MGGNFSRHKGVELSSGDILMFLDDDDTWNREKIAKQIELFRVDPAVGLVYCHKNVIDEKGNPVRKITPSKQGFLYPDILFSNIIGTTSSVSIKREVYMKAGGFDVDMPALQDYDLWIRATRITKTALADVYGVNYMVANQTGEQVSKSGDKQKLAVELLLRKYDKDIAGLSFTQRRKIISNFNFYIAKSYRGKSMSQTLYYACRSFINYPNLKAAAIILPEAFLKKFV